MKLRQPVGDAPSRKPERRRARRLVDVDLSLLEDQTRCAVCLGAPPSPGSAAAAEAQAVSFAWVCCPRLAAPPPRPHSQCLTRAASPEVRCLRADWADWDPALPPVLQQSQGEQHLC